MAPAGGWEVFDLDRTSDRTDVILFEISFPGGLRAGRLVISGLLGIAFGFYSAPSNIEESKEMVASHDHDYEHSSDHDKSSEYYNKYEYIISSELFYCIFIRFYGIFVSFTYF